MRKTKEETMINVPMDYAYSLAKAYEYGYADICRETSRHWIFLSTDRTGLMQGFEMPITVSKADGTVLPYSKEVTGDDEVLAEYIIEEKINFRQRGTEGNQDIFDTVLDVLPKHLIIERRCRDKADVRYRTHWFNLMFSPSMLGIQFWPQDETTGIHVPFKQYEWDFDLYDRDPALIALSIGQGVKLHYGEEPV